MLGGLYKPSGLARETARAVLETENIYACNIAFGCSNRCRYCYVPKFTHYKKDDQEVRLPKKPPIELVQHQLEHHWKFHWTQRRDLGVFLSFLTDPFLPQLKGMTESLIDLLLRSYSVKVATLSKIALSQFSNIRHGMTIVSLDDDFWKKFEPNTLKPKERLSDLHARKRLFHDYVWISMEPYPPSAIYKQNLIALLEELKFIDLIIFGMWNYDKRARTEQARREYSENINTITDFCKSNLIRLHIKSNTLAFVERIKD